DRVREWLRPGPVPRNHRMITYACPNCGKTLQSPRSQAGYEIVCPGCKEEIQIPSVSKGSNNTVWWVLGILGLGIFGCGMLVMVSVLAITALGTNSNKTFETIPTAPNKDFPRR